MPNKKKKKRHNKKVIAKKRNLITREDDMQEYAKIIKMLGDRRVTVVLPDSSQCIAIIPGRFRKRCWMKPGDIILVGRREYQNDKLDVLYKYNEEENRVLVKMFEIPEFFLNGLETESNCKNMTGMVICDDDVVDADIDMFNI